MLFAGTGEPLLHKKINEIVEDAGEAGLDVAFTTNGILLADQAEASRTAELLARVNTTFELTSSSITAATTTLEKKLADMAEANQRALSEVTRSLSAHIGEMEDKLDKSLGLPPG